MKLIKRGAELVQLTPTIGSGWQRANRGSGIDATTNDYPELMTVTAHNCDGVRVFDYDTAGNPVWESTGGKNQVLTVIKQGRRGVVWVLNPTSETKVTISTIPLSLSLVNALTCFVRRCGHGFKTRQYSRPDGFHPVGQWGRVGHPVRGPRAVGGGRDEYSPGPWPLPYRHGRRTLHHDLQCVPMGSDRRPGDAHRLPGNPRIRHTLVFQGRRHRIHHTPGLATVGGGA